MEDPNSTLLPYILETLSRKPELCDTIDNLCREVQEQLMQEQNSKYGNVKNSIQRALSVGQSLGIITLTNEIIRVPFSFRQGKNAKAPTGSSDDADTSSKSDKPWDKLPQQQTQPQPQQQQTQQQQKQQQKQPKKNDKKGKVRSKGSDHAISPSSKHRGVMPRKRAKSAPRKVRSSNSRAKSTSRSRRGRKGRSASRGKR